MKFAPKRSAPKRATPKRATTKWSRHKIVYPYFCTCNAKHRL